MSTVWLQPLTVLVVAAPAIAFALLLVVGWLTPLRRERFTLAIVGAAFSAATLAALTCVAVMAARGEAEVRADLGTWFTVGHYHFRWELVLDRLSAPFAVLGAALVGLIAGFSRRYLHRESGHYRFYLLLSLFGAGVELVVLAGSLDLIFIGWELVGLTSALLIAFFHERPLPVRHGLRAFVTYRACDVGLLGATVWLHHSAAAATVTHGAAAWTRLVTPESSTDVIIVGLLLLWATMGKSAQVPLGGWLPRAMEGPTPSSAIFYGALSVHLGPYLLLRSASLLDREPVVAAAVVLVGASTALHATFVGRVQSDIKSALSYATMTQIGLIFVEIGLGLRMLAVAHIAGHACIRTLQILRSPSLLHDHHHLEQAMGAQLPRTGGHLERLVPRALQPWLYRHALERGYFDALLQDHVVGRFLAVMRGCDRAEQRWVDFLAGRPTEGGHAHGVERSQEALR
ncbi:MAG: proton-conducting transporter membrane subunit [Myxococcales bacterium]|jgi:NADH:ubiquinone oxidoreductase subunit 5 (subunit L)/multisubunit Na+/H+ antiporter MnhA subunit